MRNIHVVDFFKLHPLLKRTGIPLISDFCLRLALVPHTDCPFILCNFSPITFWIIKGATAELVGGPKKPYQFWMISIQ